MKKWQQYIAGNLWEKFMCAGIKIARTRLVAGQLGPQRVSVAIDRKSRTT